MMAAVYCCALLAAKQKERGFPKTTNQMAKINGANSRWRRRRRIKGKKMTIKPREVCTQKVSLENRTAYDDDDDDHNSNNNNHNCRSQMMAQDWKEEKNHQTIETWQTRLLLLLLPLLPLPSFKCTKQSDNQSTGRNKKKRKRRCELNGDEELRRTE